MSPPCSACPRRPRDTRRPGQAGLQEEPAASEALEWPRVRPEISEVSASASVNGHPVYLAEMLEGREKVEPAQRLAPRELLTNASCRSTTLVQALLPLWMVCPREQDA